MSARQFCNCATIWSSTTKSCGVSSVTSIWPRLDSERLKMNSSQIIDDKIFLEQFEATTFPFEQWHHRIHIKAAYLYLRNYPFAEALEQMRSGTKAYILRHHSHTATKNGH